MAPTLTSYANAMTQEGQTYHIADRHIEWLREMTAKFDLPDEHKALRVLFEYAMQDGDQDDIFDTIRCGNC